jgi:hypothetical protein
LSIQVCHQVIIFGKRKHCKQPPYDEFYSTKSEVMATAARFSTVTSCWCIRNKVSVMVRQCAIVILSLCLLADLPQVTAFTVHRLQDSSSPSSGGLLTSDKAGYHDNSLTFKSSFRQDTIDLIDNLLATLEASETKVNACKRGVFAYSEVDGSCNRAFHTPI